MVPVNDDLDWLRSITRAVRRVVRALTPGRLALAVVLSLVSVSVYATVQQRAAVEVTR
jgi:hypothetical protein